MGALGTLTLGQGLPGGRHPHPPGQKTRRSLMTRMPTPSPQSALGRGEGGAPLPSAFFVV